MRRKKSQGFSHHARAPASTRNPRRLAGVHGHVICRIRIDCRWKSRLSISQVYALSPKCPHLGLPMKTGMHKHEHTLQSACSDSLAHEIWT
jgi:hypothetical protein